MKILSKIFNVTYIKFQACNWVKLLLFLKQFNLNKCNELKNK